MRLRSVIKKEFKEVIRDKGFLISIILEPLIVLLVFGYTFQADIKNLNTVVIDNDHSQYSLEVIKAISNSEYFKIVRLGQDLNKAKKELEQSKIRAIFYIPPDFSLNLKNAHTSNLELYIDSSDYTVYNILKGSSGEVIKDSLSEIVKIITKNLEDEKNDDLDKIEEIRVLTKELDESVSRISSNSEDIDVYDILDHLSELEDNLYQLENSDPRYFSTVNPLLHEIKDARDKIREYSLTVDELSSDSFELEPKYNNIRLKVDEINLTLKSLNKNFLSNPVEIKKFYIFGEISYFQYLTPAILTLILFFIGVVLTTINLVGEKTDNTLSRISTTPIKRSELIGGKFIVFFIVGIIETIYVILLAIFLFNVKIEGSLASAISVLLLLMASSIGLGLLISAVVKTMRQAVMIGPLIIIPSILVSQTFSPIEVMPRFMQYFAYLSPMYYSNVALREIMIKGSPISSVLWPVSILILYALITIILGIIIFKKKID